ncbi:hypothetical protein Syun_025245 [Stephania yunnanensis]|uniref:Isopenicillin N synthase-like Fe(2+) 2OG dioxygenase domain-containing protein n=1 Tax=Stephania yunnanensis TaxID=152371 RepID=A0AAP0ER95_9MAGN
MVLNCHSQCPEPDLTLCMTSHSDYGFLTILLQDEAEGLQILYEEPSTGRPGKEKISDYS